MDSGELFVTIDLEKQMLMWFVENLAIKELPDMEMFEHWGKNRTLVDALINYASITFRKIGT